MKRFIISLFSLVAILVLAIVIWHIGAIFSCQAEMDDVYKLAPDQDVLFLGSSQVGCDIEQSPRFHNKCIWMSDTIMQSCLIRLKELERRSQLNHVKVLAVPFNMMSIVQQNEFTFKWAWYRELALAWRHLDMLPCGIFTFSQFIASNLRCPLAICVEDHTPIRLGLDTRPEEFRKKFFRYCDKKAKELKILDQAFPGQESSFYGSISGMKEICDRNNIRFVVFETPILPYFNTRIPREELVISEVMGAKIKEIGVEIINLNREFQEECFFDEMHLMPKGATIFTSDVYRSLNLPFGHARVIEPSNP